MELNQRSTGKYILFKSFVRQEKHNMNTPFHFIRHKLFGICIKHGYLQQSRYDGQWSLESALKSALSGDRGLVLKDKAKHSAIASRLTKPFHFEDREFIVQYEINFQVSL